MVPGRVTQSWQGWGRCGDAEMGMWWTVVVAAWWSCDNSSNGYTVWAECTSTYDECENIHWRDVPAQPCSFLPIDECTDFRWQTEKVGTHNPFFQHGSCFFLPLNTLSTTSLVGMGWNEKYSGKNNGILSLESSWWDICWSLRKFENAIHEKNWGKLDIRIPSFASLVRSL